MSATCHRTASLRTRAFPKPRLLRLTALLLTAAAALSLCPAAAAQDDDAAIHPGELVFVDVHRRPELTTTAQVDSEGNLPLPYVGNVHIAGLTEAEAKDRIASVLRSILKNPSVTVSRGAARVVQPQAARTAEMNTQVIGLNNARAETLSQALQGMTSEGGTISFDPNTNTLIITDTPGTIQNIMAVISQIDQMQTQVTQVRIEAKIAEVETGAMKELGVRWFFKGDESSGGFYPFQGQNSRISSARGNQDAMANERLGGGGYGGGGNERRFVDETPYFDRRLMVPVQVPTPGQMFFGFLDNNVDLGVMLDALVGDNKAQLLANPMTLAVNHKPAQIKMVDEYPYSESSQTFGGTSYSVNFMDLGIILDVTPHVYRDATGPYVQLELQPEVSYATGLSNGVPIRSVRSSDTIANVRDGQTLVIGGIVLDDNQNTVQRVPGVSRIPLLGNLFKHKENTKARNELMIFVTPKIHDAPESITWDKMLNLSEAAMHDLELIPAKTAGLSETRKE